MAEHKKNISILFLGNPEYDSRVSNLNYSLEKNGFSVKIIGFDWRTIKSTKYSRQIHIHKLNKKKPLQFYFSFYFILIKELLKTDSSFYFAEDVYTLPVVYLFAKRKRAKVFYDSREIYANLGGLRNKKIVQRIIQSIEKTFIQKVDYVITTGEMDTELLKEKFDLKNVITLRNLPLLNTGNDKFNLRQKLNIPNDKLILLYQGVLLEGRGIELILETLSKNPDFVFVLLGDGEFREMFETKTRALQIEERVFFIGSVHQSELIKYTRGADIGVALIENISLSYYYALPNKLFEYIMAGVPAICSDLPQMEKVITEYKVGEVIDISNLENISSLLKRIKKNPELLDEYADNCREAAKELNWQNEFERTRDILFR